MKIFLGRSGKVPSFKEPEVSRDNLIRGSLSIKYLKKKGTPLGQKISISVWRG